MSAVVAERAFPSHALSCAKQVSVDYYVTSRRFNGDSMLHEKIQKEGILRRWELNGMRPDDVAIIADADEVFTRDFLRVLQTCDVPELRHGQDCRAPKVLASTLVLKSTPECITSERRWYHPDAALGECVERMGNRSLHPPPMRGWQPDGERHNMTQQILASHGPRNVGHGGRDAKFFAYEALYGAGRYPLWTGGDFRDAAGGKQYAKQRTGWTGYHFHNFFGTQSEIHFKYHTYGHPDATAMRRPLWELAHDLAMACSCTHPGYHEDNFATLPGGEARPIDSQNKYPMKIFESLSGDHVRPIYYLNKEVRRRRHSAWQHIVQEEEMAYKRHQPPKQ